MTQRFSERFFGLFSASEARPSDEHPAAHRAVGSPFILGFILFFAFWFRMWQLDIKPPHFDEGINGHFVAKMWKDGYYHYDPTNFHGPLYFYFLQTAELLLGPGIVGFRVMTGLISMGIVFGVAFHRRFVGATATWAALFIAVSPAFTFYSRYAIHESLFILLSVVFSYGWFAWVHERSKLSVICMVTGFFGSLATKETFFIFFGTWAIALGCVKSIEKLSKTADVPSTPERTYRPYKSDAAAATIFHVWAYVLIGALVTILLFTGFLLNPKGVGDMFTALAVWTKTGTGATGHEKPFTYWIQLLWTYERPFLIALSASPLLFFSTVSRPLRVLVLTGFGTWLAYSLIPYKTPWLILNMMWPLSFGVGLCCTWFWKSATFEPRFSLPLVMNRAIRFFVPLMILVAFVHTVSTSLRLNFRDYAKSGEPYVYVQSTHEFKTVMDLIFLRVKERPEDLNLKLGVFNKDPWPMPWMLGRFPYLQWGTADTADLTGLKVILIDDLARPVLESRLEGRWWVLPFQIRDSYNKGYAFLDFETFNGIVPSRTEIFEKAGAK